MEEQIVEFLRREDSRGDVEGRTPAEISKEIGASLKQVQRALDELAERGEIHLLNPYWYPGGPTDVR